MGHYDFYKDKIKADVTEVEVAHLLCEKLSFLEFKGRSVGKDREKDLIFNDNRPDSKKSEMLIEVKEDFYCQKSGNVAVEYFDGDHYSGINATKADYWVYKVHEPSTAIGYYIMPTRELKRLITEKKYHRDLAGGDKGETYMYLFHLEDIQSISVKFHKE
jgi:hypothetical protein